MAVTEKKPPNWLWYWGLPLGWVLLMQVMTLRPNDALAPVWFPGADKLVHLLYFGGFALLMLRGFRGTRHMAIWPAAIAACLITIAYGTADELKQNLQPHRMVELADWFANLAGAAVALVVPFFRGGPRP